MATRVALVEAARRTLAEWPAGHYNYRRAEVQQMLTLLDEVIADLRAASGGERFSLNMLVFADPPTIREPLLPSPTEKETVEQTLSAARVVDTAADREDLLKTALTTIDRSVALPAEWAATTRAAAVAQLVEERRVDRSYRLLTQGIMAVASQQARMADVRGLQRLELRIEQRDRALGGKRPEVVTSLVAAVEAQLDAARRLRLARDRWALRAPVLRDYQLAMSTPLAQFAAIRTSLEDLKSLAGGSPLMLASVENSAELILRKSAAIVPPDELKSAHALLVSAVQLAQNAVAIRREAVLAGSMARAWDASSAAAGALMLGIQARRDIQASPPPARTPVISPRRTRLVRVSDLHAFRHAIVGLARAGDARAARARLVIVPTVGAALQLGALIGRPDGPELVTRDGFYDSLHARLDPPPRRLTPYERDVVAQAAVRVGRQDDDAGRARRRGPALLRSAAAAGPRGGTFRGTPRGRAGARRGVRPRGRAHARPDATVWRRPSASTNGVWYTRTRATSTAFASTCWRTRLGGPFVRLS